MDLITKIQNKVNEIKRRGDIPTYVWLGKSEKSELQNLLLFDTKKNKENYKDQSILGLDLKFLDCESWISVGCQSMTATLKGDR